MREMEVVAHASLFFDRLNLSSVNAQLRYAMSTIQLKFS